MSIRTSAPHWSLWMIDPLVDSVSLPAGADLETGGWDATWDIYEVTSTATRAAMLGSLSMSAMRQDGVVRLNIFQDIPMYWKYGVEASIELVCQDGPLLRPLRWDTHCVTGNVNGDFVETLGAHDAFVDDRRFVFDGVSQTTQTLPEAPLTSTWSLMAAFPRIVRADEDVVNFCMLDELLIQRPNQKLVPFTIVEFPTVDGPVPLLGYRLTGTGTAPLHYWVTPDGWPMLICGLRRAFVARTCTPRENLER